MTEAPPETVAALIARAVVLKAEELGADAHGILASAGVPAAVLTDPTLRLTGEETDRVWEHAVSACRQPALGFLVGIDVDPIQLGPASMLCAAAPTLADAMHYAERYGELIGRPGYRLRRDGEAVYFTMDLARNPTLPSYGPSVELSMAVWKRLGDRLGGTDVRPRYVRFRHQRPAHAAELQAFFGCCVTFDAAEPELSFTLEDADRPSSFSDPALVEMMCRHADVLLAQMHPRASTTQAVVAHLQRTATTLHDVSAESTAKALGISPRTLYRRLKAEGDSYQAVVDRVRKQRCLARLAQGHVAPAELSAHLGFAETSSFYRAFRRWTGRSFAALRDARGTDDAADAHDAAATRTETLARGPTCRRCRSPSE